MIIATANEHHRTHDAHTTAELPPGLLTPARFSGSEKYVFNLWGRMSFDHTGGIKQVYNSLRSEASCSAIVPRGGRKHLRCP